MATLTLTIPGCPDCCCTPCNELSIDPFPITVADIVPCTCPTGTGKEITALTFSGDYDLPLVAPGEWRAQVGSVTIEDCGGGSPVTSPVEVEVVCADVAGEQKYLINAFDDTRGYLLFSQIVDCQNDTAENAITQDTCDISGNLSLAKGGSIELRA